jgi:multidrug efflux system membrane fusion protein
MAFRGAFWVVAIVVAAAAYGAYAPATVDKISPQAGAFAHRMHDLAFGAAPKPEAAAAAAGAPPAAAGPRPIAVAVEPVKRADFPIVIEGLGQVQAYNNVTVRARVDGQIMKIGFREGDDVKAGDLVAQIDSRPFQAALDQAKAKKGQDEANLANAKLDQQRYSTLAKQNYATQQQLDTQNSLVAQLTAAIAADAAAVDAAQVQLDYTTIRAPISGRIGLRLIDEGNLVSGAQQTAIVTIAELSPISVIFTVPETHIEGIAQALEGGQQPSVSVTNTDGKLLAVGLLKTTDNQVDAATGTLKMKADFDNKDHALWPGLAVTAALTTGVDKDALTIPTVAVQHSQTGLYVYVVDGDSRAALRPVKISRQTVDTAVVASGLKPEDRVITTNLFLLQPGTPVRVDATPSGS